MDLSLFDTSERTVIEKLLENGNEQLIDELSWKSGINVSELASVLLMLELKGVVKPLPGKKFRLLNI